MNNIIKKLIDISLIVLGSTLIGCSFSGGYPISTFPGDASTKTGAPYNDRRAENPFLVREYEGQPLGPDLTFIEGGRVILGSFEEDLLRSRDNLERTVTVASFYMDETEVANIHWLEYLHAAKDSGQQYYEEALPDTTVWSQPLAANDPYVSHYLRYPGFRFYPVVGVTWLQVQNYCQWRTAVVNQQLVFNNGDDEEIAAAENGEQIPLESGIVLPNYRLPTEAEWEYAAQALIGVQDFDENYSHRRIYPWDGHSLRNPYGEDMGFFLANFKRGRGDYAGIAGKLNDADMITTWIYNNPPNDFGLYNMAGNVSEWVEDIYPTLIFSGL